MALQVWLPLNKDGDLTNKGLANITVTNNGATYDANGKIGGCYSFNTSRLAVNYGNGLECNNFSITCWVKPLASLEHCIFFGFLSGNNQRLFVGEVNGTYNLAFGYKNWGRQTSGNVVLNEWQHIIVTVQNNTASLYLNSQFVESLQVSAPFTYTGNLFFGGRSDGFYSNVLMNDIRVYNHCLSETEIKEISRGLVLWYPLNKPVTSVNPLVKDNNLYLMKLSDGSTWAKVLEHNDPENNIFPNKELAANYTAPNLYSKLFLLTTGNFLTSANNYEFLFQQKTTSTASETQYRWTQTKAPLNTSQSDTNSTIGFTNISGASYGLTVKSDYTLLGHSTGNTTWWSAAGSYKAYHGGIPGIEADVSVITTGYLKLWVRVDNVPYTVSGLKVYDSSGYNNNGTVTGSLSTNTNTHRYDKCTIFNGSSYIAAGQKAKVRDQITVNWWGYMSDWSKYTRAISCTEGGGWNFEPASGCMSFALGYGETSNTYSPTFSTQVPLSSITSGWHMFTGTWDGFQKKLYIDGALRAESTKLSNKSRIYYNPGNGIFIGAEAEGSATTATYGYFNGYLSDIRIYAIALSQVDIVELYNHKLN